jgi:hypothetical protein
MFKDYVTWLKLPVMGSGETLIFMFCHLKVKLLVEMMFVIHARVHLGVATQTHTHTHTHTHKHTHAHTHIYIYTVSICV